MKIKFDSKIEVDFQDVKVFEILNYSDYHGNSLAYFQISYKETELVLILQSITDDPDFSLNLKNLINSSIRNDIPNLDLRNLLIVKNTFLLTFE